MYLRPRDYDRLIQSDNLTQIISADDNIRILAEMEAKEEVESYLISKYDTASELTDLVPFDINEPYYPGQRYMLSGYAAYNPTGTYAATDKPIITVGTGNTATVWLITTDLSNDGPWQDSYGVKLGQIHDIFTIQFGAPVFDLMGKVSVGDLKSWKGLLYKALKPWIPVTHQDQLQAKTYPNGIYPNIIPDQDLTFTSWYGGVTVAITGYYPGFVADAWDIGTIYSEGQPVSFNGSDYVSADDSNEGNTPGDDIKKWIPIKNKKGDSRSQQLVSAMIDVSLYHIHSRIAPRNIPDLRVKRYDDAIQWLKDANSGNVTPNLPLIQPYKTRIRFGGATKTNNIY